MRRHATVFLSRDAGRAIVVTMNENQDGVWCEHPQAAVLERPDAEALGIAAHAALMLTSRVQADLRDRKLADWPALRASGTKSARQFQQDFVQIEVISSNDANVTYEITGPEIDDLAVTTSVSSSARPADFGARLLRVHAASRDRIL